MASPPIADEYVIGIILSHEFQIHLFRTNTSYYFKLKMTYTVFYQK